MSLRRALLLLAAALLACAGASAQDPGKPDENVNKALQLSVKPSTGGPRANSTGFGTALRCMDGLFRSYGVKNVPVIIEDIPDQTKKVNVGAREMFVSATSQMTRSSRAVRLIPYDGNRRVFQDLFKGQADIASKAAFAIQGSISQFDESFLRKQRDGGICLGPLCIGGADSDAFSGMSVDMSVLDVRDDLTLVPGAISKNFVLIRRTGRGADADLNYKKFGINYNFVTSQSDGQGQALRNLVELSAIELYGRLMKVPYWSCLGVGEADEGVKAEIDDWWEMLHGDLPSLVSWLQMQMTARQLYANEVNGEIDDELMRAVRAYKHALGMKDDLAVDAEFFRRYLRADHAAMQPVALARLKAINEAEGPVEKPAPRPEGADSAAPAVVVQGTKGEQHVYQRGEPLDVDVAVAGPGFLYCFLIDDNRAVTQFFPNPVQPSAAVAAGTRLRFPGRFPFQLLASQRGLTETVLCATAPRDLGPAVTVGNGVRDAAALRQALAQHAGGAVEVGVFDVKTR